MGTSPLRQTRKTRQLPDPAEFTPHFHYAKGQLFCEGVSVEQIAAQTGTPVYLYSARSIREAYRRLDHALRALPHRICYSVKANSNLTILRMLARHGSYFDIVSGGELHRVLSAGIPANRVVFSGVGKTREEIREALHEGILLFNVESEAEMGLLAAEAQRAGYPAPAGLRVNPDVAAGGHPHISTGAHTHKFGVDLNDARRVYRLWQNSPWISWQGISAHIGSQILRVAPFHTAVNRLSSFVRLLGRDGIRLKYFDFGGGIGIRYTNEAPVKLAEYAAVLLAAVRPLGCTLLLEPGRAIVGPSGILLTRVVRSKRNRGKWFVVTDAAMNDMMRPALYGATHPITRTQRDSSKVKDARRVADIVGPICETGDCFLHDWPIGPVAEGELLALWGTGAYGSSLATNYNSRLRAPEVLVEGKRFKVIRRRDTRADLLRAEL